MKRSNGISRQLVILNPDDAVVLETIGESLFPIIKKAQPSTNAFFSKNQPRAKTPGEFDEYVGYPWWILWPIFQKRIFNFAGQNKLIVIGDVATYYDGIDFGQLRNFLSSLGPFSEIFIDFLFFILERFVWRPDYLPFPGKGLPQINLDTPRLLAHAFLLKLIVFWRNSQMVIL